ncbi:hypothetical protein [Spirosoma pulveris]
MPYYEILDHPPLYISITDSRDGRDEYQQELDASACQLRCGGNCVWLRLFKMDRALPKPSRENNEARNVWLDENRSLMRQKVKAVINVVDEPFYEQARRINIEKAYGVCGTCCRNVPEALEWIKLNVSLPNVASLRRDAIMTAIDERLQKDL